MKKIFSLLLLSILTLSAMAQVTTIPAILQKGYTGEVTIVYNPNEGNKGMVGATACYAHTGITTAGGADWQKAGTWRDGLDKYKMTKNAAGNWELKITPNMYAYYGVPETTEITKLWFVFNDGKGGSKEGKTATGGDFCVELVNAGLAVSIVPSISTSIVDKGAAITLTCSATMAADLTLKMNDQVVKQATGATQLVYTTTMSNTGDYKFLLEATAGGQTAKTMYLVCVPTAPVVKARPAGIDMGIYYSSDVTKLTLSTYAASKTAPAKHVFVVGDFNNWTISNDYQLNRDGNYFWGEISGLTPGREYAMQYVVIRADGVEKRISDLYSTKLLHPDDAYEPKKVDPNLMAYPKQGQGYVTVVQTAKPEYAWSDATLNFKRPDKNNLLIYELWVYDFTTDRSIQGVEKRLDYLEQLGVNAIELMPICEFDGNMNWGYSPNHYFAPDKAYGSEDMYKHFIAECHKRGIAVILDMVFNHGTGLNPMNALYPYGTDLASNPWFNVKAPHGDNVYEDWNHGFAPAHSMFKRALKFWIDEYHVDGFRMDLSHGFCSDKAGTSVENILDYYESSVKPYGAYFILEHWGTAMGTERPKLVNAGCLCWNNTNNAYMQTAMGWLKDGDSFAEANKDGYVSYCESHDEERMQYKAKKYGNGAIKTDENVRLGRVAENVIMNILLDGSHMVWQFEEIGYDYSINSSKSAPNAESSSNRCEIKPRPNLTHPARKQAYTQIAQAAQLRTRIMPEVFAGNPTSATISSGKAVRSVQWGSNVYVVANFDAAAEQTAALPSGTWYDYYANGAQAGSSVKLAAGEVKIYTGKRVELPAINADLVNTLPVNQVQAEPTAATKVLLGGQVLILRDGKTYDLMGRVVR